jgi:hypothetical protein
LQATAPPSTPVVSPVTVPVVDPAPVPVVEGPVVEPPPELRTSVVLVPQAASVVAMATTRRLGSLGAIAS